MLWLEDEALTRSGTSIRTRQISLTLGSVARMPKGIRGVS